MNGALFLRNGNRIGNPCGVFNGIDETIFLEIINFKRAVISSKFFPFCPIRIQESGDCIEIENILSVSSKTEISENSIWRRVKNF